jgi:hypothetical protein
LLLELSSFHPVSAYSTCSSTETYSSGPHFKFGSRIFSDNLLKLTATYLLNAFFVALFEGKNLIGAFLGIINLFPCLHFLLFEQSNAIGKHLSIPLNATGITSLGFVGCLIELM